MMKPKFSKPMRWCMRATGAGFLIFTVVYGFQFMQGDISSFPMIKSLCWGVFFLVMSKMEVTA